VNKISILLIKASFTNAFNFLII